MTDGNKGGIVVSGGGTVWTVDVDEVDNSKLANMPANTLKANNTIASADPIDATVAQVKTMLAYTAADVGAEAIGTAASAVAGHVSAGDPHPQYLTPAEGNAAYAPIAHVGAGGSAHAVATTSTAGFLSAADKLKLDGLANYTAFRGVYASLAALQTAIPAGTSGDWAHITNGAGQAHIAVWDTDAPAAWVEVGETVTPPGTNISISRDATSVTVLSDTGSDGVIPAVDTSNAGAMTAADKVKLNGIASGATANSSDAVLLARSNHTGQQPASTISDFSAAADARVVAGVGVTVQGFSPSLTSFSGVSTLDRFYYLSASNTWSPVTIGANLTFSGGTLAAAGGGGGSFANTVISATPTADQQNWTIAGRTSYTTVLASPADNSWIGGVTGGASGDILHIQNASASGLIWLVHEDAASTAANRFALQRSGVFLLPGETANFIYNATSSRWVEISVSFDVMQVDDKVTLTLPLTAATVQNMGVGGTSITATASTIAPTATPTNDFTEGPRTQITNATANGSSDVRCGLTNFMRGATAGRQGIFHNSRVAFTALGATGGVAVGLTSSAAALTTQPQATNNTIYLCANGGQTTLRISVRDAAAGTPIDLGANFPVPSATAAYEVAFLCMPNVANVRYMVRRLDTGNDFRAQGTVTANLPANTQALGHRIQIMVGATATASTAQFSRMLTRSVS
ncbi:MAG: hypothetical protein ACRCV9_10470 [Burkholderiaceae bacterium]